MKNSIAKGIILLFLSLLTLSCATHKITIMTEPEDSKIYVDGEYLGKGIVSYDVGPKYWYPRKHIVIIKHADYETLTTEIKTKLDIQMASIGTALLVGLGAANIALYYALDNPSKINLYVGILGIVTSPITFLNNRKFRDVYRFSLED